MKRKSPGEIALEAIARRKRAKLRELNMSFPPFRHRFYQECRFQHHNHRIACMINQDMLAFEVRDIATSIGFSVNRKDKVCFFTKRLELPPGTRTLPVFVTHDIPTLFPLDWLSSSENQALISILDLHRYDSLHIYGNGVFLFIIPRSDEEHWALLDHLCTLAERLPPQQVVLEEGEEIIDGMAVNLLRLPEDLYPLIPYIRQWSVGDDVERVEKYETASTEELVALFHAVWPYMQAIDDYSLPLINNPPEPDEVIVLGRLAECVAEVRIELERRTGKNPAER